MRGEVLLHLIFANVEELIRYIKPGNSLGCSCHERVKCRVLRQGCKEESNVTTMHFRRADFGLFRDLLERIPWDTTLERNPGESQFSRFTTSKLKNSPPI